MATATMTAEREWTYDDYVQLDDGKRYEIINGELLMAPAPSLCHQDAALELAARLREHARQHSLGRVFIAPIDVIFSANNVAQPDIVFVAAGRDELLQRHGIVGVPDMLVEIISPGLIRRDRHTKMRLYARFGVREYWIVDPANRSIEVFSLGEQGYDLASFAAVAGIVTSTVIRDFQAEVAEIMPSAPGE